MLYIAGFIAFVALIHFPIQYLKDLNAEVEKKHKNKVKKEALMDLLKPVFDKEFTKKCRLFSEHKNRDYFMFGEVLGTHGKTHIYYYRPRFVKNEHWAFDGKRNVFVLKSGALYPQNPQFVRMSEDFMEENDQIVWKNRNLGYNLVDANIVE